MSVYALIKSTEVMVIRGSRQLKYRHRLTIIFFGSLLVGCQTSAPAGNSNAARADGPIVVSAAASLREAFQEIESL